MIKTIAIILAILAILVLAYWFVIRPWDERWGATPAELSMALPGDDLILGTPAISTRAITIHAPAAEIYPWLVQLGQGRGGFYSYDWLENLFGCDIHSASAIMPELQNTQIGDKMKLAPYKTLPYYQFVLLQKDQAVVLRSVDPASETLSSELWIFALQPVDGQTTRLIVRHRNTEKPGTFGYYMTKLVFDPMAFIMERGMMYGIRTRAES